MTTPTPHPPEAPDSESLSWIQRAQAGDRAAYERLFERYYARVRRLVRRRAAGSREHGEIDAALVLAIQSFDVDESLSRPALVVRLAEIVGRHLDGERDPTPAEAPPSRARGTERQAIVEYLGSVRSSGGLRCGGSDEIPQPEDHLVLEEDLDRLWAAFGALGRLEQRVLACRQARRLEWSAIARELGLPSADEARRTYSRAKIALVRIMRHTR